MTEQKQNAEQCTCGGYHNEWLKPLKPSEQIEWFEGLPPLANHYRALSDRVKDLEKWKLEMEKRMLKVSMKRTSSDDTSRRRTKAKKTVRKKRTTKKKVRR